MGLSFLNQGASMSLKVDLQDFRNIVELLLRRVEEGETIVIMRGGKPIADLMPPHQAGTRWMTPADVMAIRELASADPTWADDWRD
jgi:antitoxin (DNA-binding transcriptional repressor) of toxin-antitoxin stability system